MIALFFIAALAEIVVRIRAAWWLRYLKSIALRVPDVLFIFAVLVHLVEHLSILVGAIEFAYSMTDSPVKFPIWIAGLQFGSWLHGRSKRPPRERKKRRAAVNLFRKPILRSA